ncbi:MAG: anthranilate phosphoribosyltransferase [Planctomycetales bacterium]|nr:anthranilate phosphoribosyltransferase [Planctomycetales bacterium]
MIEATLDYLTQGHDLSADQVTEAFDQIMQGRCSEAEIALLLAALRNKGETCEEIAGAARAMRRHMTRIGSSQPNVVDTCGTGGGGSGTFNISTAAALVTAAAGVPVAKHGNRRITSKSGSADVLAELGVNVEADVATVEACLAELGVCFCFAPLMHGAMRHVAAVRRKLAVPTIFNLLGPLSNPAEAPYQVLGVPRDDVRRTMAEALALLGTRHAVIVRGDDGLGEVSLAAPTAVIEIVDGRVAGEFKWQSEDFGLATQSLDAVLVDTPAESAAMIRRVLAGEPGAARDIVVLNAAAAIWVTGAADDLSECARRAAAAIDNGAARERLQQLVLRSGGQGGG